MDKLANEKKTWNERFLKWCERRPLTVLVGAICLIFGTVVVGITIFYVPNRLHELRKQLENCQQLKSEAEAKIPVPPTDPDDVGMSLTEIHQQYQERSGRDAEQESFSKSLNGKHVNWEVEVSSTYGGSGNFAIVYIRPPDSQSEASPVSMVLFSDASAARAASLQDGDTIRLWGTLSFSSRSAVEVKNPSFEFLKRSKLNVKSP